MCALQVRDNSGLQAFVNSGLQVRGQAGGGLFSIGDLSGAMADRTEKYSYTADSWAVVHDMLQDWEWGAAVGVGTKAYAENDYRGYLDEYDPAADDWTARTARAGGVVRRSAAAEISGDLYVSCGERPGWSDTVRDTDAYDPATDSWDGGITEAPAPARSCLAAASLDGELYIYGGNTLYIYGQALPTRKAACVAACDRYTPLGDSWAAMHDMLAARDSVCGSAIRDKAYVYGGFGSNGSWSDFDDCDEYDPASDGWTAKHAMTFRKYDAAASTVKGRGVVHGGWTYSGPKHGECDAYLPSTDTWDSRDGYDSRMRHGSAAA